MKQEVTVARELGVIPTVRVPMSVTGCSDADTKTGAAADWVREAPADQ